MRPARSVSVTAPDRPLCPDAGPGLRSLLRDPDRANDGDGPGGLHVSVSRPLVLRHYEIKALVSAVSAALAASPALGRPVAVALARTVTLAGDDGARTFVGLAPRRYGDGTRALLSVIEAVDAAVTGLGRPAYYPDPTPHVSVGWYPSGTFPGSRVSAAPFVPPMSFAADPWSVDTEPGTVAGTVAEVSRLETPVSVRFTGLTVAAGNERHFIPFRPRT